MLEFLVACSVAFLLGVLVINLVMLLLFKPLSKMFFKSGNPIPMVALGTLAYFGMTIGWILLSYYVITKYYMPS